MMLLSFLKKDIRQFSRRKANVLFMFLVPIVLIILMSYSLDRYMEGNVGTFQDGRILYMVNTENEHLNQFTIFKEQISSDTGVQFEEIHSYEDGVERVNRQEAYAVISIHEQGFDYYRSPYNEELGGKLIRTAFDQNIALILAETIPPVITTTVLEGNTVNSFAYFTFSGLGLIMLYISSIIAHSVSNEKELRTLERIKLSNANIRLMLVSKIVFGLLIGVLQIAEVYIFSSFVLDVHWGSNTPLMICVLLTLAVFSSTLGAIVGIAVKNKLLINNLVLMLVVLIGFLGGAFSPITMLENIPVVSTLIKGSPLYWSNQALTYLYSGTIDASVWIAMAVCLGSSLLILALYRLKTIRPNSTSNKGVARHA
ncbi:ABC transporter permease [Paenibacillaceae bacterium WGS1546]|uniref:ABC transporter permease n=1 Tax=Cohnella sp. WGS1546 TaxID=3366810 RepID=UPI00372D2936